MDRRHRASTTVLSALPATSHLGTGGAGRCPRKQPNPAPKILDNPLGNLYPLVKELAADGIPVAETCRVLKLARQPYYRWLADPVTDAEYAVDHCCAGAFGDGRGVDRRDGAALDQHVAVGQLPGLPSKIRTFFTSTRAGVRSAHRHASGLIGYAGDGSVSAVGSTTSGSSSDSSPG
jgi:hypothetical protein